MGSFVFYTATERIGVGFEVTIFKELPRNLNEVTEWVFLGSFRTQLIR